MRRGFLLWSAVALGVAVAVVALAWLVFSRHTPTPSEVAQIHAERRAPQAAAARDEARRAALAEHGSGVEGRDTDDDSSLGADDMSSGTWEGVDLEKVRQAMPDNLYWKFSQPTKDEAVIEERAAERDRWNVEYGKILSGTASEEEIRAYYDRRAQLGGDYIEFATYLLDHYGDALPERDVGLLGLARRLNQARLEEIPRKLEEAFERKRQQDEARAAWLADEAAFADKESDGAPR